MKTFKVALCLGAALSLAAGLAANAHEMFLEPTKHYVPAHSKTTIALINGVFNKSENEITRDRMQSVVVVGGGKTTHPAPSQWHDDRKTSFLDITVGDPGTYVVGVSTKTKIIEQTADGFDAYLAAEGITNIAASRKAGHPPRTPVKERYSKHVRAIVQVGAVRTPDASKPLGYAAEILLLNNPAALRLGDTLTFKATYKGGPMAGQTVTASYDEFPNNGEGHAAVTVVTDAAGQASFKLIHTGRWYINLVNMQKTTGDADYESNWSTVTFQIP